VNLVLSILLLFSFPESIDMVKVRTLYFAAAETEEGLESLKEHLESLPKNDILVIGYKAMATMMEADYNWNPYKKYDLFNLGKDQLENTIALQPNNAELIYLRYGVQTHAPSILNYSTQIKSDRLLLLNAVKAMNDHDLKTRINNYLLKH
jgi:hypothetical protein